MTSHTIQSKNYSSCTRYRGCDIISAHSKHSNAQFRYPGTLVFYPGPICNFGRPEMSVRGAVVQIMISWTAIVHRPPSIRWKIRRISKIHQLIARGRPSVETLWGRLRFGDGLRIPVLLGKNITTKVMLNFYFISSDDMFIEAKTHVRFPDAVYTCTYQNIVIALYDAFPSETSRPSMT